jgi:biphenyl 2,3-dioxygenase beta subunit
MTTIEKVKVRQLVPVELQNEIQQFLYDEADLMDAWKIDEWFALMAEDIHYWAPTRQNRLQRELSQEIAGPRGSAYFDEDHALLSQRIQRLHTGMAWAEDPPSRIRHLICNVRVYPTESPDEFNVESSFYVFRTRLEREMDRFVGKRYDVLRRTDNEYGWQIAKRKIVLDMATLLAKNISIFF